MNTNPASAHHHLNLVDFERVIARNDNSGIIPLLCNEEDCFIDGNELDATRADLPEGCSVSISEIQISNTRPS